ncbi:TBP-associated factor 5 [Perilla frutescens var. hirtella]|uniref:TBP-associated factor 5 n=1 Tax=Perilla frutescens var. hirtella TaxID=608512 RepID=A0AAD4P772_PERFH|nr:TBP-associated factor 5 [Perilla frutescens var. hirtella]
MLIESQLTGLGHGKAWATECNLVKMSWLPVSLAQVLGGRCYKLFRGHAGPGHSATFSLFGDFVLSSLSDSIIRLWSTKLNANLVCYKGHNYPVWDVQFSPMGHYFASTSHDRTARIWSMDRIQPLRIMAGHLSDVDSGECVRIFIGHRSMILSLAMSPDGRYMASGDEDGTIMMWDLASGRCVSPLVGHGSCIWSLAFSPFGDFILSSSSDSTIRLWSTKLNANLVCYKGHNYPVWDVQFSPMGHYFASASHDRTARIWSMDRIQPLRIMAGHLSDVDCVQWHANCNYIATGSSDKTVRLWDVQSGECVRIFIGHRSMILSLAMSPDGRYMASGDEDGTIMMWDLASGRCVSPLVGHGSCIWSLAFSCEGSLLASGSADCTVKIWDVATSSKVPKSDKISLLFGSVSLQVKSFWVHLTASLVEKLTFIRRFLTSKLQPQSLLPSLTNNTDDSKSHDLILQNLQKLEMGKFAFTLATTATVGLLFSQKLEDDGQAASPHYLIIVGFMVSCMLLYNGLVFGAINPYLGNFLQLIGISLVLCLLCILVGTFLPVGFSIACWVCAAFCLVPFLYILIKPHPGPYLQRFQA